jgi:hypothetical protein
MRLFSGHGIGLIDPNHHKQRKVLKAGKGGVVQVIFFIVNGHLLHGRTNRDLLDFGINRSATGKSEGL